MPCLNEGGRTREVVGQDMQGRGVTGYWDVSKGCGICWNVGCEEGGTGRGGPFRTSFFLLVTHNAIR